MVAIAERWRNGLKRGEMIRLRFYKDRDRLRVIAHSENLNVDMDITGLVDELCQYGLYDCPNDLYQAWKILRLGSSEYAGREWEIIKQAKSKLQRR